MPRPYEARYNIRMHIVLLAPDVSGRSGWSRYAQDLGKALAHKGHTITCLVAEKSEAPWCTQIQCLRQPTHYLGSALLRWLGRRKVAAVLRTLKIDIVHVMAEPYALLLPKTRNYKTCMTIHGTYAVAPFSFSTATNLAFKNVYRTVDDIISVSNFTKEFVYRREPVLFEEAHLRDKISVIHNGVDLTRFPMSEKVQTNAVKRIISVSAVKRKKGYMEALNAVALFRKNNPIPLQYDIIGRLDTDNAFMSELKQKIQDLDLGDIVHLRGPVDDAALEKAYADADVFLLPSLQDGDFVEGFGLVFLEANARGTPVIGPTTGGCPEAIDDGISGYICAPNDAAMIASKLEDILIKHTIDPLRCRAWAEHHDIRKSAEKLAETYQSLLR